MSALTELQAACQQASPVQNWTVEVETDLMSDNFYKVSWLNNNSEVANASFIIEDNKMIFNFIEVSEENRELGLLKSLCKYLPEWSRKRGAEKWCVNSIWSDIVLSVVQACHFDQLEESLWEVDITEKPSPVEKYGNS